MLKQCSKLLRKAVYAVDENRKESLPLKTEDDDLANEMEYTVHLLDHLSSDSYISEILAVKERMNLLAEAVDEIKDHYTTSVDRDARVGHKKILSRKERN